MTDPSLVGGFQRLVKRSRVLLGHRRAAHCKQPLHRRGPRRQDALEIGSGRAQQIHVDATHCLCGLDSLQSQHSCVERPRRRVYANLQDASGIRPGVPQLIEPRTCTAQHCTAPLAPRRLTRRMADAGVGRRVEGGLQHLRILRAHRARPGRLQLLQRRHPRLADVVDSGTS